MFTINNVTTGQSFNIAQAYTNTDSGMFSPVFHFAVFTGLDTIADYNASFLATPGGIGITAGGAVDNFITDNGINPGAYANWTFVGVEDLQAASTDDWNNLVYGFLNVAAPPPVPEPASLALLASALIDFGVARRRRKAS